MKEINLRLKKPLLCICLSSSSSLQDCACQKDQGDLGFVRERVQRGHRVSEEP